MTRLTAMVLTHNAEKHLADCLGSLQWVDEIIVMDDFSTDRTQEIARQFKAQLYTRRLDNFSAQRNAALEHCSGEWVLVVDADEWLTAELQQEIRQLLAREVVEAAFRCPRKNLFFGRWMRGCGWYPDYVLRLYRRDGVRYSGLVHEGVEVHGSVGKLTHALWHDSYAGLENYLEKLNRYTSLAAREMHEAGRRASLLDLLGQPACAFCKYYLLQQGFRDGLEGFLVSALSSFYVLMKYAKLYYLGKVR